MEARYTPAVITTRYNIEILSPTGPYAPREWQQGQDTYFGQFNAMTGFTSPDSAHALIARINRDVKRGYYEDCETLTRDDYRIIEVVTISRVVE